MQKANQCKQWVQNAPSSLADLGARPLRRKQQRLQQRAEVKTRAEKGPAPQLVVEGNKLLCTVKETAVLLASSGRKIKSGMLLSMGGAV
jgi:hypothetical protein